MQISSNKPKNTEVAKMFPQRPESLVRGFNLSVAKKIMTCEQDIYLIAVFPATFIDQV